MVLWPRRAWRALGSRRFGARQVAANAGQCSFGLLHWLRSDSRKMHWVGVFVGFCTGAVQPPTVRL